VSDPEKAVLTEYGAFGEKQLYGKTVTGDPVDARDRAGRHIEVAQYNVRAHRTFAKLRKDLSV